MPTSPDPPLTPREVPDLGVEIVDRVAAGEHGALWLGRNPDGTGAAVKSLRIRNPLRRRRVLRAVRQLRLQRPAALLAVSDVRARRGWLWILREWDVGVPVGQLTEEASLAAGPTAALARGVLHAIGALHERGIVHGGIKPANVFIERDGSVRLSDASLHRARRQGDIAATAVLIRNVWQSGLGAPGPQLAELVSSGALDVAETASAALALVDACDPESGGDQGREALATIASGVLSDVEPDETRHTAWRAWTAPAVLALVLVAALAVFRPWTAPSPDATPTPRLLVPVFTPSTPAPTLTPAATPTSAPSATPSAAPTPATPGSYTLQPPAPPSAPPVDDAQWTAHNGPCAPGTACAMTTWLDLGPHETQTFQWGLIAVDECNGSQLTLYTTSITASPSQTILTDSRTITIPGSHPLMLYTVSLAPVRAASRGLVVTPSSTRCPG